MFLINTNLYRNIIKKRQIGTHWAKSDTDNVERLPNGQKTIKNPKFIYYYDSTMQYRIIIQKDLGT